MLKTGGDALEPPRGCPKNRSQFVILSEAKNLLRCDLGRFFGLRPQNDKPADFWTISPCAEHAGSLKLEPCNGCQECSKGPAR